MAAEPSSDDGTGPARKERGRAGAEATEQIAHGWGRGSGQIGGRKKAGVPHRPKMN